MTEERILPGAARDNNERIQERGYESGFAQFPDEEVDPIPRPGAGPHGSLDTGPPNVPLVVIAVGLVVAVVAFGLSSALVLGLGALLVVIGGVWAGVRHPTQGSGAGVGTTTVPGE